MSLHADATAVLTHWAPPDAAQAELRERYLRHLSRHPDGVWRSCRPDHLTASAVVLSDDGTQVLLTLHGRIGRWLQLGGHCEEHDVTLAGAARREAVEESGIAGLELDPVPVLLSHHEVPCGPVRPAHHLDVQYLAHAPAHARAVRSSESADLRWFPVDALPGAPSAPAANPAANPATTPATEPSTATGATPGTDASVRALVDQALRRC